MESLFRTQTSLLSTRIQSLDRDILRMTAITNSTLTITVSTITSFCAAVHESRKRSIYYMGERPFSAEFIQWGVLYINDSRLSKICSVCTVRSNLCIRLWWIIRNTYQRDQFYTDKMPYMHQSGYCASEVRTSLKCWSCSWELRII